uniref:probable serine/threonine-protein kinase PBL25 n=1 Tax=Erigeron canadensis TaxID=72917 RepID=UPI001CB91F1E|nr:probable serine/threonine-protein kinase PBL25 [Erigeron canadensis]
MSYREPVEHLSIRLEDIKLATKNFDEKNFISGGGFGRVYKGELVHSGRRVMVAVKRLDRTGGQGEAQFWNEISILSDYKHENIIKLLGFSDEGDEKLLVYEYLPMQSLNMHLSSGKLSWVDRLNVCIGVARGLKHLHTHTPSVTKQFVLHSDIKSYNILLDTKWNAKISDFGLSRVVPVVVEHNATSFHFNTVEGTKGYCDPAYINSGCLTKENDVYSFGVLLFEMFLTILIIPRSTDGIQYLEGGEDEFSGTITSTEKQPLLQQQTCSFFEEGGDANGRWN